MKKIRNIMIVEDEAIYALTLKMMLSKAGFNIVGIAAKGETAIKEALNKKPDVMLMDIRLAGELDGIETITLLRKQMDIPVIFMTGYSEKQIEERANSLRPLAFLIKPLNCSDIEKKLNSINSTA
jgi:YesN/AraC family two-component response regulator